MRKKKGVLFFLQHVGETSSDRPENKRRALLCRPPEKKEDSAVRARERGRRRRRQKRKRNLSAPQPHFYSNMRVKRRHSCSRPSLFLFSTLSSSIIRRLSLCPFHYLFPFTSSRSHHATPRLISSLTYCIYYKQSNRGWLEREEGNGKIPLLGPASRKPAQLKDESTPKRGIPVLSGDVRLSCCILLKICITLTDFSIPKHPVGGGWRFCLQRCDKFNNGTGTNVALQGALIPMGGVWGGSLSLASPCRCTFIFTNRSAAFFFTKHKPCSTGRKSSGWNGSVQTTGGEVSP